MPNSYKGQWVSKNPVGNEDGQAKHKVVNVIEYKDGFIRAIGENIPLAEFERMYVRPQAIADPAQDPFASPDVMKGVSRSEVDVVKPTPTPTPTPPTQTDVEYIEKKLGVDVNQELIDRLRKELSSESKVEVSEKVDEVSNLSKFTDTEQFLIKAIDLSSKGSTDNHIQVRGLDLDLPLRFNLHKILQIADTMEVEGDSLLAVLREEFVKKETIEPIIDELLRYIIELSRKAI